jgi:uncharacterized repeat protein (TIGR03943 family)
VSRLGRLGRGGLLLGAGLLIFKLLLLGQLHYYLSPSFDGLTALTGVVLAIMGGLELWRAWRAVPDRHPSHAELDAAVTLGLVAVPLVAGLLLAPRALGTDGLGGTPVSRLVLAYDPAPGAARPDGAATASGSSTTPAPIVASASAAAPISIAASGSTTWSGAVASSGSAAPSGSSMTPGSTVASGSTAASAGPTVRPPGAAPAPRQPIADVGDLLSYLRVAGEGGVGQPVHARGLVARSDDLPPNEFVLVRYAIVHCVADAQPLGLLVVAPSDIGGLSTDQWVDVSGTLASEPRDGDHLVGIHAAQIVSTQEPSEPYIPAF